MINIKDTVHLDSINSSNLYDKNALNKANLSILSSLNKKKNTFNHLKPFTLVSPPNLEVTPQCVPNNQTTQSFRLFFNNDQSIKPNFTTSSFQFFNRDHNDILNDPNQYTLHSFLREDNSINDETFFRQTNTEDFFTSKHNTLNSILGKNGKENLTFLNRKTSNKYINTEEKGKEYINNDEGAKMVFQCEHNKCCLMFKTLKQKLSHHKKMSAECKKDTLNLIKSISKLKLILFSLIDKKRIIVPDELKIKYENIMSNLSLEEYAQLLAGVKFNDIKNE